MKLETIPIKAGNCVDNLTICEASCCKTLVFDVRMFKNSPHHDYYLKHGCEVKFKRRDLAQVIVPMPCPQLDERNLCKLHEKLEKPLLCKNMNEEAVKSKDYYITEGCIYSKFKKK